MDVDDAIQLEMVKCECCGLKEECTLEFINGVKSNFNGRWLCGLCSEVVTDEVNKKQQIVSVEDAIKSHASFCRKTKSNPAFRVVEGMMQILRRRSSPAPPPLSDKVIFNKYARSSSASGVGDQFSFPFY